jgi:Domain of unknown function (DUF4345)
MLKAYLVLNAALYVIFALWCTIAPSYTASALGLSWRNGSGKSEYITVYGGMEFAIAMFFLVCAFKPEWHQPGLIFGLLFYGGLVLWRIPTLILIPGVARTTYYFAASEFVLLLMALALWLSPSRSA